MLHISQTCRVDSCSYYNISNNDPINLWSSISIHQPSLLFIFLSYSFIFTKSVLLHNPYQPISQSLLWTDVLLYQDMRPSTGTATPTVMFIWDAVVLHWSTIAIDKTSTVLLKLPKLDFLLLFFISESQKVDLVSVPPSSFVLPKLFCCLLEQLDHFNMSPYYQLEIISQVR